MAQANDEVKYNTTATDESESRELNGYISFVHENGTVNLTLNLDDSGNKLNINNASLVEGSEDTYEGGEVAESTVS